MNKEQKKEVLRLSLLAVVFNFALVLITFAFLISILGYSNVRATVKGSAQRFDSVTWKKASRSSIPRKIDMVDDLLARYKLIGMNRKEIDELLGMPIPTDYMANYEYAYCLGPERASFLPIDSEWLCLKFKNQVVVEVRLLSD